MVGGAQVKGLTRFGNGEDVGSFPDRREVSVFNRKIEEFG
jgi:hypothetical protein